MCFQILEQAYRPFSEQSVTWSLERHTLARNRVPQTDSFRGSGDKLKRHRKLIPRPIRTKHHGGSLKVVFTHQ